jgi:hypothetical protein
MRLLFPLLNTTKPCPVKDCSIQPYLRREAVAKSISIFEQNRDRERAEADPAYLELTDFTLEWVTETLIQGVYVREYHVWEKEVKSYLNVLKASTVPSLVAKRPPHRALGTAASHGTN